MKDEDKTYDDLGSLTAADLFDAIWQEKKDDVLLSVMLVKHT